MGSSLICGRLRHATRSMLSEKERGALRDMLRHIELTEQFARGHSYESLRDNLQALYAVIRSLEIISEASRRLSDELKARHAGFSGAKWRQPAIFTGTIMKM